MKVVGPNQEDIDVWSRAALADGWTGSGTMARYVPAAAKDDIGSDGSLRAMKEITDQYAAIICEELYGPSFVKKELPLTGSDLSIMIKFNGYKVKRGFFGKAAWGAAASITTTKENVGIGCFAAFSIPQLFDLARQYESGGFRVHNTIMEAVQNLRG